MSAIWDAWSNHYPSPQATAGDEKRKEGEAGTAAVPQGGASLANAWGNLYAAAHEATIVGLDNEIAGPSVLDLWNGFTQTDPEGPLPSYGSGMQHIWDDLAAARKIELHEDDAAEDRPLAEQEQEAGVNGQDPIINSQQLPSAFSEWRELMQAGHPHAALAPAESYSWQLARAGFAPAEMNRRSELIAKLQAQLKGLQLEPALYRRVVASFLQRCAPELQDAALACARDYYYYWLGDLRTRAGRYAPCQVAIRKMEAFDSSQFKTLLKRMERGPRPPEPPSLGIYRGHQFENGVQGRELAAREQLLGALLFLLDRRPFVAGSYRWAVDTLLMHIAQPSERDGVLVLVRDFFYYWIAYPPAEIRSEMFE